MPLTPCIDALYEAITQYSQSWNRDVNILKEVNIVEIHSDIVKSIQEHIVQKLTRKGGGTGARLNDPGSQEPSDVPRSRSDARETSEDAKHLEGSRNDNPRSSHLDHTLGTSTDLLDRRTQHDEINDIFASNRTRQTHEGSTQTSLLYQGADVLAGSRLGRPSQEMSHHDVSRFSTGMHKFSSLPNLPPKYDDDREQSPTSNILLGLDESKRPLSSEVKVNTSSSAFSREVRRTLPDHERLHNDTSKKSYDLHSSSKTHRGGSHGSAGGDSEVLGAVGGVKETPNESLIQTILAQHDRGGQTPEQAAETQKLLDHLFRIDDSGGRSREKGHRSRRTQSLDRAPRKSREKDVDLGSYNLHSDARVKRTGLTDDELKKCSVCYSKIDLTKRTRCEHKLCRNCHRLGLYKGPCTFCKNKESGGEGTKKQKIPSSDERTSRSRTKKSLMLDSKTLPLHGHTTRDYHIRPGSSGVSGHRKGPMAALHTTSPPSSPDWRGTSRLDPVGHAPDRTYGTGSQSIASSLPDSRRGHSRTEAWVADSTGTTSYKSSLKTYDHTTYTSDNIGSTHGSNRFSARERRRQDRGLTDDSQKNDRSSRVRSEEEQGRIGGLGAAGGDVASAAGSKGNCPICMDVMRNPKTLSECKHTFCTACIDKAMEVSIIFMIY